MMADETGAAAPGDGVTTDTGASAPVAVSGAQQDSGTLLTTEPAEKPVAAPADWPDDWRAKIAGEDAKELARLQRMGSPADLFKSYRALEAKLASGQVKPAKPGENATPEELAAWRKAEGIPEKPEAYEINPGDGIVFGEADKPLIEGFKQEAWNANFTPSQLNTALKYYHTITEQAAAKQYEADTLFRSQAEDNLRAEWGQEYRANVAAVKNIGALFPDDAFDRLVGGRTADGKKIGDDPAILRGLAFLAREFNPAAPHIPVGGNNVGKGLDDRLAEIESMRRTDPHGYWKNAKIQAEERDLLVAKAKMQGRAA